jgi:hypothetical protein
LMMFIIIRLSPTHGLSFSRQENTTAIEQGDSLVDRDDRGDKK